MNEERPLASPAATAAVRESASKDVGALLPDKRTFGRYELLLEMAQGGMATIFLARLSGPEKFQKLVVLKRIRGALVEEEKFTRMFLDEARITSRLQHPNVAAVFDMGVEDGHHFLTMEHVHGQNLAQVMAAAAKQRDAFTWEHALRIVANAAAGLHAAHELTNQGGEFLGVVHRDVSPQNILIGFDGTVKVVDFGIAYAFERLEATRTGIVKGKISYMAPEQITSRDIDRRTDVFALGIVLYETVLLRRLFREPNDADVAARIVAGDVPKPRRLAPQLPAGVEQIILKALARKPEERYQTAAEFEEALNRELIAQRQHVGQRQLAAMMGRLFHQKKRLMDEQIRVAIQRDPTRPLPALGVSGDEDVSDDAALDEPLLPPRRLRGRWVVALAAVVVLAAVGGVLALRWGGDSKTRPARHSTAPANAVTPHPSPRTGPPTAPPRPLARLVQLHLDIQPPLDRTIVTFRGKEYGGPSFRAALPVSHSEEIIEIRARGYKKERIVVKLEANQKRRIRLRPIIRWRPRPRRTGPTDYSMYVKMP